MVRKHRRIVILLTIASTIITIISASWKFIMSMYIQHKFQTGVDNNASSIGIIGSADGPTAIFISGNKYSGKFTVIFALLSILGFIYLIATRKGE